ncbi:MAG: PTS transporter subunit EIIB [Bacilli bacterium]
MWYEYLLIILVLLLIAFAIVKSLNKDIKIDINKLIEYLGGKDNIISYETNMSRFIVEVKDTSLVKKESINKLGARGVVEVENKLKIILPEKSSNIKKYIDDLK